MRASEGHSRPREPRHKDKSGHGKNASQRGALTNWRAQKQRQVRTRKECDPARGTHQLESPDIETSQDAEGMRASEGHSQTGEYRHRDKLGHENNASQRGALTSWRAKTQRQVRTRKECEPARGTHSLDSPDTETCQETERMRAREEYSLSGEPGHRTCQDTKRMRTSEGHSRPGEPRHRDKSGHGKDVSQRWALTSWRAKTQRQVRTRKE